MSYFKNITHSFKQKVNNLMSQEDGLEKLIQNIDLPQKDLLNKIKMDRILYDRSGSIKRIQMKLQKAEEKNLKKHADSYENINSDFYHDLLLEIENIDNQELEIKQKDIENKQSELENEIKIQKEIKINLEIKNQQFLKDQKEIQSQKEILKQISNENSDINELVQKYQQMQKQEQILQQEIENLKNQNISQQKQNDKNKLIIQSQAQQIKEFSKEIKQLEDENLEYKNKYFNQLDELQQYENKQEIIKKYLLKLKQNFKKIHQKQQDNKSQKNQDIKIFKEKIQFLKNAIQKLQKKMKQLQHYSFDITEKMQNILKQPNINNQIENKNQEQKEEINNDFNQSIELSSLEISEKEDQYYQKDKKNINHFKQNSETFEIDDYGLKQENNQQQDDNDDQQDSLKIEQDDLDIEKSFERKISISISETEEDITFREEKTQPIDNNNFMMKLPGINLKNKTREPIQEISEKQKPEKNKDKDQIVKVGNLVINKKFLSNKQFNEKYQFK